MQITLSHLPTAAQALAVAGPVYAIILALKQNAWVCTNVKGWWAVLLNAGLTILGTVIIIPEANLYSVNTLVVVITAVLGSSGLHGMSQNIPPTKS